MWIFAGVSWRKDVSVGLSKTAIFSTFAHCFFRCFRVKDNVII